MQIEISNTTEKLLHAALASSDYQSADEFIAAMAMRVVGGEIPQMPKHIDIDELAKQQGVGPINNFRDLKADFWPQDESVDDFLLEIRDRRQHDSPRSR